MAQPLLVYGLMLAGIFISVDVQGSRFSNVDGIKDYVCGWGINALLECRVCRNALFREDCKESAACSHDEECYIDQILTSQLTIIYNAGCRSRAVCLAASSTHVGKRVESGYIGCSRCCNTSVTSSSTECNTQLCGLKLRNTYTNQCYYCGEEDANQGSVADPTKCRKIKICADDEVCRVTTQNIAGATTHSFGCGQRLQCQIITIVTLENAGVSTKVDLAILASSGEIVGRKRQTNVCDICCGDGLCNDDECDSVRTRLVTFARAGRFNYTTLKTR